MASPTKLDTLMGSFNKRREQAWRTHMGTSARMRLSVTARMSSSEAVKIKMYSACFHAEGPPPMCADISVMKRFPADRPLAALQDEVAACADTFVRPGASVGHARPARARLPPCVRTGGAGRLAPTAPRTVRTEHAHQPWAFGYVPCPVATQVAAAFDWGDSALFYHADAYGNMRPVTTHEELCKACEHWESRVGERKIKQLADLLVSRGRVKVRVRARVTLTLSSARTPCTAPRAS